MGHMEHLLGLICVEISKFVLYFMDFEVLRFRGLVNVFLIFKRFNVFKHVLMKCVFRTLTLPELMVCKYCSRLCKYYRKLCNFYAKNAFSLLNSYRVICLLCYVCVLISNMYHFCVWTI